MKPLFRFFGEPLKDQPNEKNVNQRYPTPRNFGLLK